MNREKIKSLIKSHYMMITKLEDLLEEVPVQKKKLLCPAEDIINAVNDVFNTDCREQSRRHRVVLARHCASYYLREHTDMTLLEISMAFGNTDHSTVVHSIKTCKDLIDTDESYKEKVEQVKKLIFVE
jgi:chromosomal replication initiation ATPase DnaA